MAVLMKGKTYKMKRKIMIFISCLLIVAFEANAFADVLGEVVGGYMTAMGASTYFYHNIYQSGSTYQREYYVDYKPNSGVVPIVVNGDRIYGKRTIDQAVDYMLENNMKPMIGINADYFSFKTGIPMGHTIINGEVVTNDTTGQNAVGFNADGTGFISWLQIATMITRSDGTAMQINCINKWLQPTLNTSYLLTNDFAASTKTSGNCKFIIFSPVEGSLSIGKTLKLRVDEKFDYDGEIAIPDGKLVLAMTNGYGDPAKLAFMDSLAIGEELTVTNEALYDSERWANVQNGIGCIGGRLIENGVLNSNFEPGTAPRTAVGVKADGNIIFYVIDGRQSGYSEGVKMETLAKRMQELGCVDAINLDGGGSSAIEGVFPGSDEYSVLNSPSEGGLRSCANFIFLQDLRTPTGVGEFFEFDINGNRNFLSGYRESIKVKYVVDTGGYKIDPAQVSYTAENGESTNIQVDGNQVTAYGSGEGYVVANAGGGVKYIIYNIYDTPEQIAVMSGGAQISSLEFSAGDTASVDLDAKAYVASVELNSDDSCYEYSCDSNIGTIDASGVFVPNTSEAATGNVYVRAGDLTLAVPVVVKKKAVFSDMGGHWSAQYVERLYNEGIISGEPSGSGYVYRPDSSITRGEFAVVVSKYLNLDVNAFAEAGFDDMYSVPDWQKPYVNAVYALGIISGKQSGDLLTFSGNDSLTRAEAITILGRIADVGKTFPSVSFDDSAEIPAYAEIYVNQMCGLGIISGYENNTLRPNNAVKRGECAKMICMCLDVLGTNI